MPGFAGAQCRVRPGLEPGGTGAGNAPAAQSRADPQASRRPGDRDTAGCGHQDGRGALQYRLCRAAAARPRSGGAAGVDHFTFEPKRLLHLSPKGEGAKEPTIQTSCETVQGEGYGDGPAKTS